MIVLPFRIQDYEKAELVNGVGFEQWGVVGGIESMLVYMATSGTFKTVWRDGEVVLIAGWHKAWDGVCEVSMFPTARFVENPVGVLRLVKKQLNELMQDHRRIQVVCRKEAKFYDFALKLGFQVEGVMRRYGPNGQDFLMMSIVEGDNHG